jgi:hypothetical protein
MMEALQEVLQAVGVWGWLREQFPELSASQVLAVVSENFEGLVETLEKKKSPQEGTEGFQGAEHTKR